MPSSVEYTRRNAFLILACALSSCLAFTLFDQELFRSALDPVMCARQMETIDKSEFYESSFRVPEGLRGGNLANYGNFHQCLAINQNFPGRNIKGKYCVIRAEVPTPIVRIPSLGGVSDSSNLTWTELTITRDKASPVELHLAVCVPKACTVDALLKPYAEHPLVRFNYTREYCRLPGPVNWFLSLKLWRFVARISYAMYLSSFMIQIAADAVTIVYYFDIQSLFWKFAGDLAATVALSLATCLVVEAPVATLYSMLIKRIQSRNN